ncbi:MULTISPECIES: helix-turn-helix domain-containing protein [Streptomyces]|uniref:helix-turn-helix domain-containing protein n=1 Tax=Streptomyces TaxID=1883 RepID=UPI000D51471E|nr:MULTISPECIES: helix-turn-helix domain-containing protein [Streptomyces]PVC72906.1 DNA-directed RNA polymerase sigma-70 factor [Streptomyces sp. CS065A]
MTRSTTDEAAAPPLPSPKERRRLREAKSLTEQQVAEAVGVTRATVRSWETGRTSPRGRKRALYARLIAPEPKPKAEPEPEPKVKRPPVPPPVSGPEPASVIAAGPAPASASEPVSGSAPATASGPVTASAPPVPAAPPPPPEPAPAPPRLSPDEAFDALYAHAAPGLVRQTYLLTGRRSLARESVERAFQLAWHRWPEVAVDRDPVGWVRAAAYEYAISPWHRLRRVHRQPDAPPSEPARRALFEALLDLPPAYRRTLLLYDGIGLDLPETAAETEASTPAAAGRLEVARAAVAERLPELAAAASPAEQSELLHDRLGGLARAEHVPAPAPARTVRTGGESKARLWTRAAIAFAALLIGATALTLHTAPTHYEQPISPPERVGGVPPRGGPQKLTAQDLKLQKSLKEQPAHGPERLVPRIP